jgi:hypothetical protein
MRREEQRQASVASAGEVTNFSIGRVAEMRRGSAKVRRQIICAQPCDLKREMDAIT